MIKGGVEVTSRAEILEQVTKMLTLARQATPGMWDMDCNGAEDGKPTLHAVVRGENGGLIRYILARLNSARWRNAEQTQKDARFISACSPAHIIKLLTNLLVAFDRCDCLKTEAGQKDAEIAGLREQVKDLHLGRVTVTLPVSTDPEFWFEGVFQHRRYERALERVLLDEAGKSGIHIVIKTAEAAADEEGARYADGACSSVSLPTIETNQLEKKN